MVRGGNVVNHGADIMADHGNIVLDNVGVPGLALVGDLHHGATVSSISGVLHILDPAVGESHLVLADNVAGPVPGPGLAEVGVVVVVVDTVGEAEGVGLLVLVMAVSTTVTMVSHHGSVDGGGHDGAVGEGGGAVAGADEATIGSRSTIHCQAEADNCQHADQSLDVLENIHL